MHLITSSAVIFLGCFAASAAAANCNPSFNVTSPPECISKCKQEAGSAMWSSFTTDSTSPSYIESLSYECVKGTPAYTTFMTQSGMCMMNCSSDEQADYGNREHAEVCAWYAEHKDDTCADASGSASSSSNGAQGSSGGSSASKTDSGSSASSSDASSEEKTDESAATSVKMGSLMVSVAAAGAAALLL